MQLRVDQLDAHVQQPLRPVYLISGDEPLQVMESLDALRRAARRQGYTSREILSVNREFSWDQLTQAADSLSLFAERRIIELRIDGSGPGKDGGQALVDYVERPADDAILLIQMGKLDQRSQSAKWFRALDSIGVVVIVWPVKPAQLPAWLQQRLRSRGLTLERDAIALLASRVEGNLLAAAQEVEKLCLLYAEHKSALTVREVANAVADSARYSVYDLVDTACNGALLKAVTTLQGLRQEGVPAALVLWALTSEIRNLYAFAAALHSGEPEARVLGSVWQSRKALVSAALRRLPLPSWVILLQLCAAADQIVKGARRGREWDALQQIVIGLAAGRFMVAANSAA